MAQKKPEWLIPDYPPLGHTDSVGKAAVEGQTVFYPKVVRSQTDPPISNQSVGAVSFMFFSEPRRLRNGKPVYGFFKLRGNYSEESQASFACSKIIKEVDSKYRIHLAPVGAWLPLTEEEAFIKELTDVKLSDSEVHLRDEAIKEKRSKERQIMREIQEREDELKESDVYDDPTSLKYYSMRRVTEMKLNDTIKTQRKQLERYEKNLRKVRKELKRSEQDHPSYRDEWLDLYNTERSKAGINPFIPSNDEFEEYENSVFETLEESEDEQDTQ